MNFFFCSSSVILSKKLDDSKYKPSQRHLLSAVWLVWALLNVCTAAALASEYATVLRSMYNDDQ
ncbi:hypothetical protein BDV39DRAFT_177433 [Aspergillus sergii]|uniref:Uncharacterized protein n=1 Tax=Aspergillus sergii TaxID=1034303 RepID=A0A5N6WYQ4_9EURO|nr:hypothetical protein BDV39DRAFT_177433 [Aspergillus sergii]